MAIHNEMFKVLMKFGKKIVNFIAKKKSIAADKKRIKGIKSKLKAFTGPATVEIDLTDYCCNSCIICWNHSPLINKKKSHSSLSVTTLKKLFREFKSTAVNKVKFSGAGDPFLHPDISEILKLCAANNLKVEVNTSLIKTPDNFAEIIKNDLIADLTVSLWAGDEKTWLLMHPGQTSKDYNHIIADLSLIKKYKIKYGLKIKTKFYHVITSLNYKNIEVMVNSAISLCADTIEFQTPDLFSENLKYLTLTKKQSEEIYQILADLRKRSDYTDYFIGNNNKLEISELNKGSEQKEFGRFYHQLKKNFLVNPDPHQISCPQCEQCIKVAWTAPQPYPRLSFEFDNSRCCNCEFSSQCYPTPDSLPLETGFTELKGAGSFLRRLNNLSEQVPMDNSPELASIPCTVGWIFSRIKSDGTVIPCCKGSEFPLGNINKSSFRSIWFGRKMNIFRRESIKSFQSAQNHTSIRCLSSCDNLGEILKSIK